MAMTATTNTSANTALRYLDINSRASSSSLAKLSSGSRIVRASDDAASLAVGTKLRADVTALKQASVNASQASSVLQVADGALAQTVEILMRMKALSVQAQSGSVSDNERGFLDKEFQALAKQIDSIADQTKFNGERLLDGASAFGTRITDGAGAFDSTAAANLAVSSNDGFLTSGVEYTLTYTATFTNGTNGPDTPSSSTITFTLTGDDGSEAQATFTQTNGADGPGDVTGVTVPPTLQFVDTTDPTKTATINNAGTSPLTLPDVSVALPADTAVAGSSTFAGNFGTDFQVGVSSTDTINVSLGSIQTNALGNYGDAPVGTLADSDGAGAAASITTQNNAVIAGQILDDAIAQLNEFRADVGSRISRFEFAAANLATTIENLDASRSVLLDVDMAAEMSNFSSKQVMLQAAVAMLAQANQQPQQLLKLLG